MLSRHKRNEASVAAFSRETIAPDVHLARVSLRRGENSLFHRHTRTRDTFYVMRGRLTVQVRIPHGEHVPGYRGLTVTRPEVASLANGDSMHAIAVLPGEVLVVEPGTSHCAMNLDEALCSFLCIEGIGEYDFVEVCETERNTSGG